MHKSLESLVALCLFTAIPIIVRGADVEIGKTPKTGSGYSDSTSVTGTAGGAEKQPSKKKKALSKEKAAPEQKAEAKKQAVTEKKALSKEKPAPEQKAEAKKQASTEKKALSKEKTAPEQKAEAKKQAATEKKALSKEKPAPEQKAEAKKQAVTEKKALSKGKTASEQKAEAKKQAVTEKKALSKEKPAPEQKAEAKKQAVTVQKANVQGDLPQKSPSGTASIPSATESSRPASALAPQSLPMLPPPIPAAVVPGASSVKIDDLKYKVTKFDIEYAGIKKEDYPRLPKAGDLLNIPIELGLSGDSYVAPSKGVKKVTVRLKDVQKAQEFSGGAIQAVNAALVKELGIRKLSGVFLAPDPKQIDPQMGTDLRGQQGGPLTLQIFVGHVEKVRTVAKGPAYKPSNAVDTARYANISKHSPIGPNDLLNKAALQDYVSRLNQFPGRRVDAAASSSGEPGGVYLDYLVREDKPWFAYMQGSNSGTKESGLWRPRVGGSYRQLAGLDDVLNADYSTSDFSSTSVDGSYEFVPIFSAPIKMRLYGSYSDYTADQVGLDPLVDLSGKSLIAGGMLTYTPWNLHGYFVSFFTGADWREIQVTNVTYGTSDKIDFLVPYLGASLLKAADWYNSGITVQMETNLSGAAGTNGVLLDQGVFGRKAASDFYVAHYDLVHSFYLEPVLFPDSWREAKDWKKATLAHELAFEAKGQYTLGDKRVAPQFEDAIGGASSVRGYPASVAAGDTTAVGTIEYRFHLPRILEPTSERRTPSNTPQGVSAANVETAPDAKTNFMLRPPSILGRPDWDLVFRAFLDAGITHNNNINQFLETDRTLAGTGVGLELQVSRYFNIQCDLGFALIPQTDPKIPHPISAGDSQAYLQATLVF